MARVVVGMLLVAGLLASSPSVQGQAAAAGGTIYFDATGGGDITKNCVADNGFTWGATLTPPASPGKAYLDFSTNALACSMGFTLTSPVAFSIGAPMTATIVLGCDVPVVVPPGQPGVTSSWRFELDDTDGGTVGTVYEGVDQIACIPGANTVLTATIPDSQLDVAAGDMVTGSLLVFGGSTATTGGAPGGMYVVTGDPTQYSGMTAPGIPGAIAPGAEALALSVSKTSAKALPGESAIYNVTVRNLGVATNFTMGTAGLPDGYTAAFAPLSGTLAANATAPSLLKVTIPSTASPGTKITFKVTATGGKGTNATADLTLEVSRPSVTSTSSHSSTTEPGDFTGTGDSTTKKSPGVEFLANLLAVGLMVLAMRRRVNQ